MWKKIKNYESIPIQAFASLSDMPKGKEYLITWATTDGLLHLRSFETLTSISNTEIEPNTKFTIWEKNNA